MAWKASGETDLPLTRDDRDWSGDDAREAVFSWAGWPDHENPKKAKQAFFAYDASKANEKESYKLPFATIVNGRLEAVPDGLHAVAVVLEGGRDGVDLPKDIIADVQDKVKAYYDKMGEQVPW